MNVPQDDLDGMRALAGRLKATAAEAMRSPRDAGRLLEQTIQQAAQLETRLERAGAERPKALPQAPVTPLNKLDTPANRRKARALRAAWEAALEVDQERHGPAIGTDGEAQAIELLLADTEEEIYGPAGRDEAKVGR